MEGQVIKIISNLYFVSSKEKIYECHSRGRFRNDHISPLVGDYVKFDEKQKYILEILPRKNFLVRPLVANVDQALIVTSIIDPLFSSNLLDKLLTVMEYHSIKPIICVTKKDLTTEEELYSFEVIMEYYKKIGYSIYDNQDITSLKKIFKDKTTVFTGQTGSGKSTLFNLIDSKLKFLTGETSKALGRGKHTTRHVELIPLCNGKLVDTPGFSAIDLSKMSDLEIRDGFIEFQEYPCKFRDCRHLNEIGCGVKEAVENGDILESRYLNYKKFIEKR